MAIIRSLWDFQLNTEVAQQSHEDQPSLDLVEILNIFSKDGESHRWTFRWKKS